MKEKLEDDEKRLLQKLQQGDYPAFDYFYKIHSNRIYGKILRLTKSAEIAEELLQDVFMKIWEKRSGINPEISFRAYLYKDRGFTVLGVSLDQPGAKSKWLSAIQEDHLDWTQVSDLQFWDNAAAKTYGIRSIPANFLIDPKGIIIGKNLRGQALQKKLEEVLSE